MVSRILFFLLTISVTGLCVAQKPEDEQEEELASEEPAGIEQAGTQFYRSPEERREAGLGTQITDWLKVSGLIELEREQATFRLIDGVEFTEKEPLSKNIQLALDLTISEDLEAEVVLEVEKTDFTRSIVDEAAITWDIDEWSISAGMMSPSFGEYYSHLIVGPLLEFGETRAATLSVDYGLSDNWEIGAFIFRGQKGTQTNSGNIDWGLMTEWVNEDESMRFGLSYLSDLAESDENLLQEYEFYQQSVDAISAYGFWGFEQFEITLEMVSALKAFQEFDAQQNKPKAYNAELAYYPSENLQLAIRYEISRELIDSPHTRIGMGVRWLAFPQMSIGIDYLYGEYNQIIEDEEEVPIDHEHVLAAQISIEF
ncbi:MAG: LbtU family siderophore porin [Aestuariibacter sp.]